MNDYLEQLRQRLAANSPEIGRISGQRVLCSSGERTARALSPEEMREAEARLAERETERQKQWEQWFAAGASGPPPEPEIVSHPPPPPRPVRELPPIEEAKFETVRAQILDTGVPWSSGAVDRRMGELQKAISLIDSERAQPFCGGSQLDFGDWPTCLYALSRFAAIGKETVATPGDLWKVPPRLSWLGERYRLKDSIALGRQLGSAAAAGGRLNDPLLVSVLNSARYPFTSSTITLFLRDWIGVVDSPKGAILVLHWIQALPAIAAWLSDDVFLFRQIKAGTLYELGPALRRLSVTFAEPSQAFAAWLHGKSPESGAQFLGQVFGSNVSANSLDEMFRDWNYRSSLAHGGIDRGWPKWLTAQRAEFRTPLEPADYDETFERNYGSQKREHMLRFRADKFEQHIAEVLAQARSRANAVFLLAIAEVLTTKGRIVAAVRDLVVIETLNHKVAESIAPQLVQAATAALQAGFENIPVKIQTGIGQSWLDALADARTRSHQ
jgi:hypothetical protein